MSGACILQGKYNPSEKIFEMFLSFVGVMVLLDSLSLLHGKLQYNVVPFQYFNNRFFFNCTDNLNATYILPF